jgi:hypothetical protein
MGYRFAFRCLLTIGMAIHGVAGSLAHAQDAQDAQGMHIKVERADVIQTSSNLAPDFTIAATPSELSVCIPSTADYTVAVGSIRGFADPVDLDVTGNPPGSTITFTANPLLPPDTTNLRVGHLERDIAGNYVILIKGTFGATIHTTTVKLSVIEFPPVAPTLQTPGDGATDTSLHPNFAWSDPSQAVSHSIQIALDPAFANIVESASGLSDPFFTPTKDLASNTTFYWRVSSANACGDGEVSPVFSFTTQFFAQILLVDDDDNAPDVRGIYTAALDALGASYDVWNTNVSDNEPTVAQLSPYVTVIWFTGHEFGGACGPGPAGETALAAWLDTSRCLFISSQDYLFDRDNPTNVPTQFMQTYLGMASPGANDVAQTVVTGKGVFTGLGPFALSYPFTNFSDRISPGVGALLAFTGNQGFPPEAGITKTSAGYKTVYLGFPWEAISSAADREEVLQRALSWFAGQCGGLLGDLENDGVRNGADIRAFIICLTQSNLLGTQCSCADMDGSGDFDSNDVTLFVNCLLSGECP